MEVVDEVGSCDPFDGGDDWCAEAVSSSELRALDMQGTTMYCSRECQLQEGEGGGSVAYLRLNMHTSVFILFLALQQACEQG